MAGNGVPHSWVDLAPTGELVEFIAKKITEAWSTEKVALPLAAVGDLIDGEQPALRQQLRLPLSNFITVYLPDRVRIVRHPTTHVAHVVYSHAGIDFSNPPAEIFSGSAKLRSLNVSMVDDLRNFVEEKLRLRWSKTGKALHLTTLGQYLATERPDLKSALDGMSFPAVLSSLEESSSFIVLEDPSRPGIWAVFPKASGVTKENVSPEPFTSSFHTPQYSINRSGQQQVSSLNRQMTETSSVLGELGKLSQEELGRISIPLDIVAKLMQK